jgi:hypothetical protein
MNEIEQVAAPDSDAVNESESLLPQEAEQGATDTPDQEAVKTDEQKNAEIAAEAARKAQERQERKQSRLNERFAELTAEKRAAEQRANDLMELLKGQKSQAVQAPQGEPNREQFDSYEDFVVARAEYRAEQRALSLVKAETERMQQQTHEVQRQQTQAQAMAAHRQRLAEAQKAIPDFREVVEDADVQIPQFVANALAEMEDGPALMYHMAKNPTLAAQFDGLTPQRQLLKLGQMSAAIASKPQVSAAPPPGKPVASKPGSTSEPPENPDEYMKWAEKHMR